MKGTLARLLSHGFDLSVYLGPPSFSYRVKCSQCNALVINGVAAHETRCPNEVKEDREED